MAAIDVLAYLRPVIRANDHPVLVRNPTGTHDAAWEEIRGFHDGGTIRCWAVQRANATRVLGRVSHVDNVALDLEELRQRSARS